MIFVMSFEVMNGEEAVAVFAEAELRATKFEFQRMWK